MALRTNPRPDLAAIGRALTSAPAAVGAPVYMPMPTGNQVLDRQAAGACVVCDMRSKGCWCRWCDKCRRFWLKDRTNARDPDEDADHHGIGVEACAPCLAVKP